MQTHPQTSPTTDSWVNPTHSKDLTTYSTASNSGEFSGMASIAPPYCSIQGLFAAHWPQVGHPGLQACNTFQCMIRWAEPRNVL